MASFQKTLDVDTLSVKSFTVKGTNNEQIPVNSILVTDANGGTSWKSIAAINAGVSFNTFVTTQSTFTSGANNTRLSILNGGNAGLIPSGSGNTVTMFAKAFGQIDVDGANSVYSYNSLYGLVTSNVRLTGSGIIKISTNTNLNQVQFYSPNDATSSLSTVVGNFTGLNRFLTNNINTFNSPFSTFIYSAISSFSTAIGPIVKLPLMVSAFSSFSSILGPTVQLPQMVTAFSSFSTVLGPTVQLPQMVSSFSSFSTVLGPTVQLPQMVSSFSSFSTVLGPTVQLPQMVSSFSSFSTLLGPTVQLPQMVTAFSSFSTVLGPTVTRNNTNGNFYIGNLNTSSISVSGLRQPYIQHGSNTLVSGTKVITLTNSYINTSYSIQLTYAQGSPSYTLPLYSSNVTSNTFSVYGDPTANFFWTTYGNVF